MITVNINIEGGTATMATKQDLQDAIDSLKDHVSSETAQVKGLVDDLKAQLEELQGKAQDGEHISPQEMDALVQSVESVRSAVAAIVPDPAPADALEPKGDPNAADEGQLADLEGEGGFVATEQEDAEKQESTEPLDVGTKRPAGG